MQTRKTIMATVLAAASAITLVAPALAQSELGHAAPVTGTSGFGQELAGGSTLWDGQRLRGENTVMAYDWDASDPRLTGELMIKFNSDFYEREGLFVAQGRSTLSTADGRWVGDASYVGGPALQGVSTLIMEGQGQYEGLIAYVVVQQDAEPITFSAGILPNGLPEAPLAGQRSTRQSGR